MAVIRTTASHVANLITGVTKVRLFDCVAHWFLHISGQHARLYEKVPNDWAHPC